MTGSPVHFQPVLSNRLLHARPLVPADFEPLYEAASDPLIWEQHPNPDRYKREVFENYFKGALESGGALLVSDADTGEVIGSSRYSDYDAEGDVVSIGYTFFKRSCWGLGYNYALKKGMLDHIFRYVSTVRFYIGAVNKRSQISIERLGAVKTGEKMLAYYGEAPKLDYEYSIRREDWALLREKIPY